jgi:long-chain-fatty-acid--CoA ligase ACSBG
MQFAKALEHLGVEQRSAINIMGFNCPEWAISLMGGIMHNNCITGIYTTNGPEACQYQAENSDCQVVVVDTID